MADRSNVSTTKAQEQVPEEQLELFPGQLLHQMIAVERERIDSANRRTEVARYAIQTNDAADQRQYDYQMARLNAEDDDRKRRYHFASRLIFGVSMFSALALTFLVAMAFYGDGSQSEVALRILQVVGIALGGYGVGAGVASGIRKLLTRQS